MTIDYPGAVDMLLPTYYSYSSNAHKAIVQHSTGGNMTVQSIYNTFYSTMRSAHFGIGLDGTVAQFVPLARGAGGNCCPDSSHNAFWNPLISQYGNLNLCTISIEHCNDSQQSLQMTQAQMEASNKLTLWLCQQYGLGPGDIWGHDSINATGCPGKVFYDTYWQQMLEYVKNGGSMSLPPGWSYEGSTLHTPGADLVLGFATHVYQKLLAGTWEADDYPDKPQVYMPRLEASNEDLGDGDQIITKKHVLGYPHNPKNAVAHLKNTVIEEYVGVELQYTRDQYTAIWTQHQKDTAEIAQLKAQIVQLQAQSGNPQVLTDMQSIEAIAVKYRAS